MRKSRKLGPWCHYSGARAGEKELANGTRKSFKDLLNQRVNITYSVYVWHKIVCIGVVTNLPLGSPYRAGLLVVLPLTIVRQP